MNDDMSTLGRYAWRIGELEKELAELKALVREYNGAEFVKKEELWEKVMQAIKEA
jgi:hypothetical protein